jgi:hypothetical protein
VDGWKSIMTWDINNITKKLTPVVDDYMRTLKENWFEKSQKVVPYAEFIPLADEWFKSTKLNNLQGWENFPCIDVIMGCTHFIESFILQHGWDGMQILPEEYSYYTLVGGKYGSELGQLIPNTPLILSLPNWKDADLRPDWSEILKECESKNIDIHIDFAWLTTAKDIEIDLSHPCIKSFAMSMSKYGLEWNRIGLRWSRQRHSDAITMFNHYYGSVNTALTSCGAFMINNIPRDYGWNTYGDLHFELCRELDLTPTKLLHVARSKDNQVLGIGQMLSGSRPHSI